MLITGGTGVGGTVVVVVVEEVVGGGTVVVVVVEEVVGGGTVVVVVDPGGGMSWSTGSLEDCGGSGPDVLPTAPQPKRKEHKTKTTYFHLYGFIVKPPYFKSTDIASP